MIRICSWCKKVMGEKPPLKNKSLTHGICDDCRAGNVISASRNKDTEKGDEAQT